MKINTNKLSHWLYLVLFGMTILSALILRPFVSRKKKIIVLYGHKLNSNLKGIYDYSMALKDCSIETYFLTMDPDYFNKLRNKKNILLTSKI